MCDKALCKRTIDLSNADKSELQWVTYGTLNNFIETCFYNWSEPVSNPTPFYIVGYLLLHMLTSTEGVKNNALLNRYLGSPAHRLDENFLSEIHIFNTSTL